VVQVGRRGRRRFRNPQRPGELKDFGFPRLGVANSSSSRHADSVLAEAPPRDRKDGVGHGRRRAKLPGRQQGVAVDQEDGPLCRGRGQESRGSRQG
jgi:hypothetical protein